MMNEIGIKKTYNTAIHSILGELKYRILYLLLLTTALVTFIYFNFGFYIEFQGSYYLNYYQCIDFNWSEGIKELNESATLNGGGVYNSLCADRQDCLERDAAATPPQIRPGPFLGPALAVVKGPGPFIASPILIEIDEFKQLFVNFVIYFSGQVTFIYDLSASHLNKSLNAQDVSFLASTVGANRRLVFNFYIMLLFYQLTAFLAYQIFSFLSPATAKQFRLKLFRFLQTLLIILLTHFLALPYAVSMHEELSIESLDSELFFSVNFDLLNSWVECFYCLLVLVSFFIICYFSLSFALPHRRKAKVPG